MITRLKVKNFKSLRNLDLTLGPLNVLVGPNMVGKSNVVDVFQFVYQLFFPESGTQGLMYALAQRGGINEVLWKGGYDKLVSIALEGQDETDTKYKYSIEFIGGTGDFVAVQNESLKHFRDGGETDLISQEQGMNKYMNLDGTVVGGVGTTGISAMQYAAPNWDGFKFCQWVKLWRFYHLVPTLMKQPSSMSLGQVLSPSGNNLSSWLLWLQTNSPESFARVNEVLHDMFPDVDRIRTIPTPDGNVHLAVTEKDLVRGPTGVWQTSDGFLVLTALLSLIYVPPTLSGTFFCIEEPENHLHPKLLETLVALLRQVRQEVVDAGGTLSQLLITTQSPYLVNQLSIDEIIWVEKKQGETRVQHLADKQNLRKLVEDEEFGLGELVFKGTLGKVMNVGIVVEHERDYVAYDEFIRKIRPDFETLEYPCGDVSTLKREFVAGLKYFQYFAPNTPHAIGKVFVIRDSDCKDTLTCEEELRRTYERSHFVPDFDVQFHATKCELETWLLVDENAINEVSQRRGKGIRLGRARIDFETYKDAKELFVKRLSEVRLPDDSQVYREIALHTDINHLALNCPNFRRFIAKVQA